MITTKNKLDKYKKKDVDLCVGEDEPDYGGHPGEEVEDGQDEAHDVHQGVQLAADAAHHHLQAHCFADFFLSSAGSHSNGFGQVQGSNASSFRGFCFRGFFLISAGTHSNGFGQVQGLNGRQLCIIVPWIFVFADFFLAQQAPILTGSDRFRAQ